jgi:hypothetical protein
MQNGAQILKNGVQNFVVQNAQNCALSFGAQNNKINLAPKTASTPRMDKRKSEAKKDTAPSDDIAVIKMCFQTELFIQMFTTQKSNRNHRFKNDWQKSKAMMDSKAKQNHPEGQDNLEETLTGIKNLTG